jgi:hypothetical protein
MRSEPAARVPRARSALVVQQRINPRRRKMRRSENFDYVERIPAVTLM